MVTATPLGIKRTCPSCNNRFYDLNKKPASCPKCQHTYDPTVPQRVRRVRKVSAEAQDVLVAHMAKNKLKSKKAADDDIEGFGEIEPVADSGMEEIEDVDDIEGIEELEDIDDSDDDMEDELEESIVGDKALIDKVEETEGEEDEEEDARPRKKAPVKRRK